jgi:hypothetical protein
MGIKRRQYTQEQKEEIIQALLSGQSALQLGREHQISPGLINRWKRQYLDGRLKQNNNNQEINKLKKGDCQTGADDWQTDHGKLYFKKRERIHHPAEKRRFIHCNWQLFPSLQEGCRLMGIPRSTFYYQKKENGVKGQQEILLKDKIQDIAHHYPYYGYRRITAQLHRENVRVNHKRVLRIMHQLGIQGRIKRRYTITTNSRHSHPIYPNLIKEKIVTGINQV